VSLVDSRDDGVVAWMTNTAEATASWLTETAEGKDSIGVTSWVVETVSALRCGWRRQRRRWRCGWRRAKTALASRHGWRRQRRLCVVGGGDSVGVASWVVETTSASRRGWRRRRWRRILDGGDSVGVASWVVETTSASRRGWRRRRRSRIVGGGDSIGVVSWVAEMTSTGSGSGSGEESGWRRQQRVAAAGPWRRAKSDNSLMVCCKGSKKNGSKASKQAAPSGQESRPLYPPTRRYQFPNGFAPSLGGKPSKDSCYSGMIYRSYTRLDNWQKTPWCYSCFATQVEILRRN
jgi:hypothetical protein